MLRLLLIEDSADDAELLALHLQDAGMQVQMQRIDRLPAIAEALAAFMPDVVVCDGRLPGFVALDALRIVREHAPSLPFVHCPGGYDEEPETLEAERLADASVHKDHFERIPRIIQDLLQPRQGG